jgi:site-specific DNA recombinase
LSDRQRQLDDEIPKGQAVIDVPKIAHLSQEEIVTEAKDLYSRWTELPKDEKRRIVEAITEAITIGKEDIEIALYYAPTVVVG